VASAVNPGSTDSPPTRHRLALRIRVFHKGAFWYAECVDLSLIARRFDQDEALRALVEQVTLYLGDAVASRQWEQMVPRPASWRRQLWYYRDALIDFRRHFTGRSLAGRTYKIPTDERGNLVGVSA
jgi:hypothetical protein